MLAKCDIDVTTLHIVKETSSDVSIKNEYNEVLNVLKVKLDMPSIKSGTLRNVLDKIK